MKCIYKGVSIQVYQLSEKEFMMFDSLLNSTIAVFQLNVKTGVVFNFTACNAFCYDLREGYANVISIITRNLQKEVK